MGCPRLPSSRSSSMGPLTYRHQASIFGIWIDYEIGISYDSAGHQSTVSRFSDMTSWIVAWEYG